MNQIATQPANNLPVHMQQDTGKSSSMQNIDNNTSSGFASINLSGGALFATKGGDKIALGMESHIIVVGIAANPWRSYFYRKYDPSQEAKRPDCYSSDGIVPHPTATQPGGQTTPGLCQTCTHSAFNSAVKFKENGSGKGKACNEKMAMAVMFYGDVTETVYRLILPPTSIKSLRAMADMMKSQWHCQAPEKMVMVMHLTQEGTFNSPVINFTPVGYVTDEMWPSVKAVVDSGNVASMLAPPEYDEDETSPPHAYSAAPVGGQPPVAQAPVPQAPVAQAPVPQAPVAQAPVPQAPVAQAPVQQYTWPTDITGWNYPTDPNAYQQWFASLPHEGQIEFGRQMQIAHTQPAPAPAPVVQAPVPQTPIVPTTQELTPGQKAAQTRKRNAELRAQGIDPVTMQPIAQVPVPQATAPVIGTQPPQAGTVFTPPALGGAPAFGTAPAPTAPAPMGAPTGAPAPIQANTPEQAAAAIGGLLASIPGIGGAPQAPVGLEDDEIPF